MGLNKDDQSMSDATRDLGHVARGDWPLRDLPGAGPSERVPIIVKQSVLNAVYEHGHSRTDVEVCGVLVGGVYRGQHGPYVYIEAMIQGVSAGSAIAQVTFTSATWDYIQDTLDKLYPTLRIIGWYHTHPGFGIFLSDMDLFIHNNFFNAPEQLAFVFIRSTATKGCSSGRTARHRERSLASRKMWMCGRARRKIRRRVLLKCQ